MKSEKDLGGKFQNHFHPQARASLTSENERACRIQLLQKRKKNQLNRNMRIRQRRTIAVLKHFVITLSPCF